MPTKKTSNKKSGPDPETLTLPGNWKKALKKAIQKPKPKGGWPKPEKDPKG